MRVAAFVNLENMRHPEWLKEKLSNCYGVEPYYSEKGNTDLCSLCTGVQENFRNFKYVLLLSSPADERAGWLCAPLQRYYLYGMIESNETFQKCIGLLEQDDKIGALTIPMDISRLVYWSHYENWSYYYPMVERWLEQNDLHIPISKESLPIINSTVALIRTQAIQDIEKCQYERFDPNFFAYSISLYQQAKGFIPHYVAPSSMLIDNYFSFESFGPMLETPLKSWLDQLENELKSTRSELTHTNSELVRTNSELVRTNNELECKKNELADIQKSTSWRITRPLRIMADTFRGRR